MNENDFRNPEQNLMDWDGNVLFKNSYYRLYIVNGDETICPDRFIVSEKNKGSWVINSTEEKLSMVYKTIYKISEDKLIATDENGEKYVLNGEGKEIIRYKDYKDTIPNIYELKPVSHNGRFRNRKK